MGHGQRATIYADNQFRERGQLEAKGGGRSRLSRLIPTHSDQPTIMGCCISADWKVYPEEWVEAFQSMKLELKDVQKLERVFDKIDQSNDDKLSIAEMLAYLDIDRTKFSERVFSIFDDDKSGEVSFKEFVLSMWNYGTLTKASLILFAVGNAYALYYNPHSPSPATCILHHAHRPHRAAV